MNIGTMMMIASIRTCTHTQKCINSFIQKKKKEKEKQLNRINNLK